MGIKSWAAGNKFRRAEVADHKDVIKIEAIGHWVMNGIMST